MASATYMQKYYNDLQNFTGAATPTMMPFLANLQHTWSPLY
jgi:hypothetical protein